MKSRIMPVSNLEAKFYKSNRLTFEYNFFWFRQLGIELRHGTPYSPFELEVPRFDGSDLFGWICKVTQFFNFH